MKIILLLTAICTKLGEETEIHKKVKKDMGTMEENVDEGQIKLESELTETLTKIEDIVSITL